MRARLISTQRKRNGSGLTADRTTFVPLPFFSTNLPFFAEDPSLVFFCDFGLSDGAARDFFFA